MKLYRKGADFEREICHRLTAKGYIAIRSAGSKTYNPDGKSAKIDVIAIRGERIRAIQCKAFSRDTSKELVERERDILKREVNSTAISYHYLTRENYRDILEDW